ncbi:hypothetical protein C8R47DRAFT_1070594 [Mycena vitilis]|nr:hypothetical protein C8R47DRAFT_1070594 [Mycena vitilis]
MARRGRRRNGATATLVSWAHVLTLAGRGSFVHPPLVLSVCFLGKPPPTRHDKKTAQEIGQRTAQDFLAAQRTQCHRWRTLRLACTAADDYCDQEEADDQEEANTKAVSRFIDCTADRLVQLVKLNVALDHEMTVPNVFTTAPLLREVALNDWRYRHPPGALSIDIPWTQVTHYHGSSQMVSQLTILAAAAPLPLKPRKYRPTAPSPPSQCARLHTSRPYLETFSSRAYQHSMRLLSFRQRSSCASTLTKLVLMIFVCSETGPDFVALNRGLPAFTYLFRGEPVSRERIHAPMFDTLTTSNACPSLTLFLYGYDPTAPGEDDENFAWDAFFAMAQSRIQRTRPCGLQCLRLLYDASGNACTIGRIW